MTEIEVQYTCSMQCKVMCMNSGLWLAGTIKPEVKDRIMSHEHPVTAAVYNSKFNQVLNQTEANKEF